MKYSLTYRDLFGCSDSSQVFDHLMATLTNSNTYWDYFVNWQKVRGNVKDLEIDLNTLNYLVGQPDVEAEFRRLLRRQPSIVRLIPVLIACRERSFRVLTNYTNGVLTFEDFDFHDRASITEKEIDQACRFASKTGLLDLFHRKTIKSVPDYVIGVEVGLDSNGRKNRGGTTMEAIVESLLKPICEQRGMSLMVQATAAKIRGQWGIVLQVDKSDRRFDFAVRSGRMLYLVETNFYGGSGSKLKATAGEYKSLFDYLSPQGHKLIWVTDGMGWESTRRPLEEAFNHLDYVLNLRMATSGLLAKILEESL